MIRQFTNVALRVASLAAKLILTLYMGRYLGMEDLGIYGLVFASVTIMAGALGMRLDYAVGRDLVCADSVTRLRIMRDQILFLVWNYGFFALAAVLCAFLGVMDAKRLFFIFVISVLENVLGAFSTNLIAMGAPLFSTILFFLRAGAWCLVAVGGGLLYEPLRSVDVILSLWALGEFIALLLNLWYWRNEPWGQVSALPFDWSYVRKTVRLGIPMWLGTIGAMLAISVDRFVVSSYLTLEDVGIITFYSSFAIALLSLVQSGFFTFSYPRLIEAFQQNNSKAFWIEAKKTGVQAGLFVLFLACILGVLIPWAAPMFGKPRLASESWTLWLLLAGIWIRANADTLYYVLYARNQDTALWLGALLFLIPALGGNLILVPLYGLAGAGYSSVLSCLFLLAQRAYCVWRNPHSNSAP